MSHSTSQPAFELTSYEFRRTGLYLVAGLLIALVYASASVGIDSDKPAYELYFSYLAHNMGVPVGFDRVEPAFFALTWLVAKLTNSTYFYFWLIFSIEFFGLTCRAGKRSPMLRERFFLVLLWLGFPFFYSLSINAVRQGLALVFVIYAIDAELSGRRFRPFILLAMGTLFHFSTAIYAPLFLLLRKNARLRVVVAFWLICVVCAILAIPQHLITWAASNTPPSLQEQFPYYYSYLTGQLTTVYDTGFKFRFLAFSALPLAALFVGRAFAFDIDRDCAFVLKIYLVLNGLFFLIGYIPFSDRIALLSWQLMPPLAVGLTPPTARPFVAILAGLSACAAFAYFFVL
nr:hypothetical protein HUO10_003042 [Paraburkholderia busanensis]